MTRVEIVSAVKQIIAAVVDQHELLEATDVVAVDSKLHDDLGMDEVDHIDGPDHRTALEQALSHAREQVIIHSRFVSEQSIPAALPLLIGAAAKGTIVHIFWGQEDEKTNISSSREADGRFQRPARRFACARG